MSWAHVPPYAYVVLMLLSRMAFRHRECVRARGEDGRERGDASGGTVRQGMYLCMLPLGLIQIGPLAEYLLRGKGWIPPLPQNDGFFAITDPIRLTAGLVLFGLGVLLAAKAGRRLARSWHESPNLLCTAGPYATIRHPMYAGYLLQGAGCGLMLGALWSWALYVPALVLIVIRISVEDRELAGCFPGFDEYRRGVKRLVPGVL